MQLDLLGEGEESGELAPGKSLVFAVLEVCLCLLVRQIPALNPNPDGATAILSQKGYVPSEESGKLIALSLNIMESLPTLCSPQGKARDPYKVNMINSSYGEQSAFNFFVIFLLFSRRCDSNSTDAVVPGDRRDTGDRGANGQRCHETRLGDADPCRVALREESYQ